MTVEMQWALPVRNEQRCCSAAEWLQEALQKSCKSAGLQQPQILAAVESPLTAINSAFAAVQKIPESRSALQSGCKVASKRQVIFTGNALPLVSTKKRNAGSNNAIIKINGRGVDKALMRVNTTRKSKWNFFFISQGFWYFILFWYLSQIWKDFQEQVLRKIGQFHGKFEGETSPRNNQ